MHAGYSERVQLEELTADMTLFSEHLTANVNYQIS